MLRFPMPPPPLDGSRLTAMLAPPLGAGPVRVTVKVTDPPCPLGIVGGVIANDFMTTLPPAPVTCRVAVCVLPASCALSVTSPGVVSAGTVQEAVPEVAPAATSMFGAPDAAPVAVTTTTAPPAGARCERSASIVVASPAETVAG